MPSSCSNHHELLGATLLQQDPEKEELKKQLEEERKARLVRTNIYLTSSLLLIFSLPPCTIIGNS